MRHKDFTNGAFDKRMKMKYEVHFILLVYVEMFVISSHFMEES